MKLHDLHPNEGATKRKKRVGRGIAAGQGKTAGRGTKGQNARSGGGVRPYFEGGQLPLVRKLPFARGYKFFNPYRTDFQPVNLDQLNTSFDTGAEVSPETLAESGLIQSNKLVVILGRGEIDRPLKVMAHRVSDTARVKIETAGGVVELLPWTRGGHRTR
ncbi:MAG TPA: 50S ribosomal protein L15 [Anaerolineae bacterium]|nr:50S ribosomal protein L15 [Anaerolineae bacterium]